MTFGINAQRLVGQRLGVGRYIEYLIKNWSKMLSGSERVVFHSRDRINTEGLPLTDQFSFRPGASSLSRLAWEQIKLPMALAGSDVLFGPSYTLPLAYRGRTVVATHSVNEIQPGTHEWWYFLYKKLYKNSARKADRVIVPSESTKADLQTLYGVPAEIIEIIPQGADDSFCPIEDSEVLSATRRQLLGGDRPYVLFVGKLSQRRNIPLLISAFAEVKKRTSLPHHLVLFGPNHLGLPIGELAAQLGVANSVFQTDGKLADHRELSAIYNAADVFVNASAYEGWSMTTTEALACGTAVIATNRGALGEITAGHALMIQEPAVKPLADAIEQVLTNEPLRQELRVKARRRGIAFRWEDTSRQTLDVLRTVALLPESGRSYSRAVAGWGLGRGNA